MKKLFTTINLLITLIHYSYSQDTIARPSASYIGNFKYHISVGYSWNLFNHLMIGLTASSDLYNYSNKSYLYKYVENGKYDFIKSKAIHTFVIDYHQRLSKYPKGTYGFSATYDFYKEYKNYNLNDTLINMTQTTQALSVMGNGYFHYLKKSKIIGLYLGGDIGFMIISGKTKDVENGISEKNMKIIPMGSFTPFGIELKTKISPYLQASIGSRGWLEGGLRFSW